MAPKTTRQKKPTAKQQAALENPVDLSVDEEIPVVKPKGKAKTEVQEPIVTETVSSKGTVIKTRAKDDAFMKRFKYRRVKFPEGSTIETDTESMFKEIANTFKTKYNIDIIDMYTKQSAPSKLGGPEDGTNVNNEAVKSDPTVPTNDSSSSSGIPKSTDTKTEEQSITAVSS